MKSIGVRELRQRASEFLREVERGEVVEVTAHGRLVARLVPVKGAGRRALLVAGGRLTQGQGDLLDMSAPLPPGKRISKPSVSLARARANER